MQYVDVKIKERSVSSVISVLSHIEYSEKIFPACPGEPGFRNRAVPMSPAENIFQVREIGFSGIHPQIKSPLAPLQPFSPGVIDNEANTVKSWTRLECNVGITLVHYRYFPVVKVNLNHIAGGNDGVISCHIKHALPGPGTDNSGR